MSIPLHDAVQAAQQAARTAGRLLQDMQHSVRPREKGPKDLVSEADLASEDTIRRFLTKDFPDILFVGEEQQAGRNLPLAQSSEDEYCWIVDPLDGTTNYVHGMENYSVSIGLRRQGQIVAGVVYHPTRDQMYWAVQGTGAFRNDAPLTVSRVTDLDQALVAASFPANVKPDSPEIDPFVAVLCRSQALRRLGSAALNLCYVAAGQLDAYWATSVRSWDVAAGWLLVTEAGGTLSGVGGEAARLEDPHFVAASTASLHGELLAILNSSDHSR